MGQKLAVLAALALVLGLPFIVRLSVGQERAAATDAPKDAKRLIIVTPHVEQIREEFGPAFDRWHTRTYGQHVAIDWRTPGGTSDIIKQLEATAEAAARKGEIDAKGEFPPGIAGSDLFFGGGSFEHGKMKEEKAVVTSDGKKVTYRLGRPAGWNRPMRPESRAAAYESRLKMTRSGCRATAFSTLNVPLWALPKIGIWVSPGNFSRYLT